MEVLYNLIVDFVRPNKSNLIIVSEGDSNSRVLHFTLLQDKVPVDMTDVVSATIKAIKPDGSVVFADAAILEDEDENQINELAYTITSDLTKAAGKVTLVVSLLGNMGEVLTSFEAYINVRNALYNEDDYVKDDEVSGFRDLLAKCQAALKKMEQMVEKESLPNPYALNLTIEGVEKEYDGSEEVSVTLNDLTYLAEDFVLAEATDESAAKVASEAAASAEADRIICADAKIYVASAVEDLEDDVESAQAAATQALGAIVQCNASARDAEAAKEYVEDAMSKLPSDISGFVDALANLQTGKQDKLTAGSNITITNNVISANVPSLNGYATESWVEAKGYVTDISGKQDKLTAGSNITITGNTISAVATTSYTDLDNKPSINNVTLSGNKSLSDLGIASSSDLNALSNLVGNANALLEEV